MENFNLLASPLWVNLIALIPFILWFVWKKGLNITKHLLIITFIFSLAFGITEAIVVVYLRTIGHSDIQQIALTSLPSSVVRIEMIREACTLIMITALAILSSPKPRERWAVFFYAFSIWDIAYYLGLKLVSGWPQSFATIDILFLIPVPWISQIWFPILVSSLIILVVLSRIKFK